METMLRDRRAALLLVGPALLIYSLIVLVPVVWTLAYTLFEGNVLSGFLKEAGFVSSLATDVLAQASI